jgi:hypothetical protein
MRVDTSSVSSQLVQSTRPQPYKTFWPRNQQPNMASSIPKDVDELKARVEGSMPKNVDEWKAKVANFNPDAILRGAQLTFVGAHRALQNPRLFTNEHYRQAAVAVAAGLAIRMLVEIPVSYLLRERVFVADMLPDLRRPRSPLVHRALHQFRQISMGQRHNPRLAFHRDFGATSTLLLDELDAICHAYSRQHVRSCELIFTVSPLTFDTGSWSLLTGLTEHISLNTSSTIRPHYERCITPTCRSTPRAARLALRTARRRRVHLTLSWLS